MKQWLVRCVVGFALALAVTGASGLVLEPLGFDGAAHACNDNDTSGGGC